MLEDAPRCTHIKISGHPCHSPALKGKNFCYFHQRVHRHVATPYESNLEPQFVLDNEESIQYAIMQTLTALVRGTMDHKTAVLVLRGLNIAVKNRRMNNVRFDHHEDEMVREAPDYPHQYLLEHPEYGPPLTQEEVAAAHEDFAKNDIDPAVKTHAAAEHAPSQPSPADASEIPSAASCPPPESASSDAPITPSRETASLQASAAGTLSARQSNQWREIRRLQSSFKGARRGNLKDLKTCFRLIGLFPTKAK